MCWRLRCLCELTSAPSPPVISSRSAGFTPHLHFGGTGLVDGGAGGPVLETSPSWTCLGSKRLLAPVRRSRSYWELVSREYSRTPPPPPLSSCTSNPCPLPSLLPAGTAGQAGHHPLWPGRGFLQGRGWRDRWTPEHQGHHQPGGGGTAGEEAPYLGQMSLLSHYPSIVSLTIDQGGR